MRLVAAIATFIAAINWSTVLKFTASASTPLLAYFGRQVLKVMKNIATKEDVEEAKTEVKAVKSDVAVVKSDVAAVKVDVANVKDSVTDVANDLSAVRREVAHRHLENQEHIDHLHDEIKHQNDISAEAFVRGVGEPLAKIAEIMTRPRERNSRSTDPVEPQ